MLTKLQLQALQSAHAEYLKGKPGGKRADLRNADWRDVTAPRLSLSRALLSTIDGSGADLRFSQFPEADLFCAVLRRANLSGCNFFKADLRGAKLTRALLSNADFREADMRPGDVRDAEMNRMQATEIQDAVLDHANFARADLSGSDMTGASARKTNFSETEMTAAILSGADCSGANFQKARLVKAILGGAVVDSASFKGADLRDAILRNVDVSTADFEGARLEGTRAFFGIKNLPAAVRDVVSSHMRWLATKGSVGERADFTGRDLSGTNFASADLSVGVFRTAKLNNVNFTGAFLTMADLRGADLSGARLIDVDLRGADLRGAILRGAVLEGSDLGPVDIATKAVDAGSLRTPTRIEYADFGGVSCESVDFGYVDVGQGILGQPKTKTSLKRARSD
ncbi:pentapeptide repeat family protein [alpha proteobacterium BAL199]|nr:pentapeptide repeat family protein [alpha proteobacterium BAL199]